jgi:hypothetical protein
MLRRQMVVVSALLVCVTITSAQTGPTPAPSAPSFRWQNGQILVYKVEEATEATDVKDEDTVVTKTRLNLTKRWQVTAVDAQGVATLQLSLTALRQELTTGKGDTLLFDSANSDKSNPQLKEQMSKYVGQTLAVVRVDGYGRVVEVKESKFGPASGFESELLPFVGVIPPPPLKPGQQWERAFKVILDPPQGTGEKYDALQRYTCKASDANGVTVAVATEMKTQPDAAANRVPLLQKLLEGEIVFDYKAGRLQSASLKVDKEVKEHQGEGSSYHYTRSYKAEFAGDK